MSGINPNYKGCAFCGKEECDCPYTGKEGPDETRIRPKIVLVFEGEEHELTADNKCAAAGPQD